MKRFAIIHRKDDKSQEICKQIRQRITALGYVGDDENPELVICVGGDGTMLHAFHHYLHIIEDVAFIGIHTGTLGFATDYQTNNLEQFFSDLEKNECAIEEKSILEVTCFNDHEKITLAALNEVRVENIVKTQHIHVYLNDEYFELFRGNGLCISGQYGSTAYNRSIGGAVIYSGLNLLQITEISGIHHRHARSLAAPLILAPDTIIKLEYDNFDHALLCYDHLHIHLNNIHRIEIKLSTKKVRFAHFRKISHIEKLNALF